MTIKIPLPEKFRSTWLAALRSGKYKQARGTLYNPQTKGFCCLGVAEHCALDGNVETFTVARSKNPAFKGLPTSVFWESVGVDSVAQAFAQFQRRLVAMNDGNSYDNLKPQTFKTIANYIEKNTRAV